MSALAILALTLVNLLLAALLIRVSHLRNFGPLSGSALNGLNMIALLSFISALMFVLHFEHDWIYHPRITFSSYERDRLTAYAIFTTLNSSFLIGLLTAVFSQKRQAVHPAKHSLIQLTAGERKAISVVFWTTLLLCLLFVLVVFNVRTFSDIQNLTSDRFNTVRAYSSWEYLTVLLRTLFFLYIVSVQRVTALSIVATALVLICMLVTGTRFNIIVIAIAILSRSVLMGRPISWKWLFLTLPTVGLIAITLRYFLRAQSFGLTFPELVEMADGWGNILLNPFELHTHKSTTSLITLHFAKYVDRYIGEEFVGALLLPIPRSIIEWKPVSLSIEYSIFINPQNWAVSQSQATLGAFNVMYIEFGLPLGVPSIFICGFLFARHMISSFRVDTAYGLVSTFFYMSVPLIIYRSGITQIGQFIWPSLLALLLILITHRIFGGTRRDSPVQS